MGHESRPFAAKAIIKLSKPSAVGLVVQLSRGFLPKGYLGTGFKRPTAMKMFILIEPSSPKNPFA